MHLEYIYTNTQGYSQYRKVNNLIVILFFFSRVHAVQLAVFLLMFY